MRNYKCKECGGPIPVDENLPNYVVEELLEAGLCEPCMDLHNIEATGGLPVPEHKKCSKPEPEPVENLRVEDVKLTAEDIKSVLCCLKDWPGVDNVF